MADRSTGTFTFAANFETEFQGPLDARLATPELAQLTDGSLPFAYNGMVVAVTDDPNDNNGDINGLYLLIDNSATPGGDINKWTRLGDSTGGGNPVTALDYDNNTGELKITLTHDGTGSGNAIEYTQIISFTDDDTYTSALPPATEVPTAVGGIDAGTTALELDGLSQNQMWDKLLFPTVNPTGSGASTALNDGQSNLEEIQKVYNVLLTSTADQGTLSNPAGVWTGDVINAEITGPGGPYNPVITTPATLGPVTVNNHEVVQGTTGNRWTLTTTFADGPDPLDSTGAVYLPAKFTQDTRTDSTQFEGVWPIYIGTDAGESQFSKRALVSQSANNISISQGYGESSTLNHRIAVPVDMVQGGDITIELDAGQLGWQPSYSSGANAGGWVKTNMTFDVHPLASGIQYYLYTKSGTTGGANNYRINW